MGKISLAYTVRKDSGQANWSARVSCLATANTTRRLEGSAAVNCGPHACLRWHDQAPGYGPQDSEELVRATADSQDTLLYCSMITRLQDSEIIVSAGSGRTWHDCCCRNTRLSTANLVTRSGGARQLFAMQSSHSDQGCCYPTCTTTE